MKTRNNAQVQPTPPAQESPALTAAPDPAAELAQEIAQLELEIPKVITSERVLGEEEQPLRARLQELDGSISAEEATIGALEQRLAAGEDLSDSIDASERKKKGFESIRNGVKRLLAIKEGERKAAGAEIGRLSELLARKRTEREMGEAADAADAADIEVYKLSARLISAIPERERLRAVLCDRFREAGGIALYNARILVKRAARREEAVRALRDMGMNWILHLNRFVVD